MVRRGGRSRRLPTFGQLARSWLARIVRVCPENERRHVEHLAPLHRLTEHALTKASIEAVFKGLLDSGRLGPSTINMLRSTGKLIVEDAQGNRQWMGPNPFALVRRLRCPQRVYAVLTLEEARALLGGLEGRRYREIFTLIALGLRPGELVALRKVDLDARGFLTVHRSYGRDQTKTGKVRRFLVPGPVLSVLSAARAASPSAWLFPREDGNPETHHGVRRLSKRLRAALNRAGVIRGFRLWCNERGCRLRRECEERPSPRPRCPTHGRRLWCRSLPKHLAIYDLRHTCATLLRELGCDPLVVQLVLGHTPRSTTDLYYSHLSPGYVTKEMTKLASRLGGEVKKPRPARRTPDG